MSSNYTVTTDFVAHDLYSQRLKGMENATRHFASTSKAQLKSVGAVMKGSFLGTFAAGAVSSGLSRIGHALRASVENYVKYEQALTRSSAKFSEGAERGSAAFSQLEKASRDIGMLGDFSAEDAAKSYGVLASAGYTVKQSIEALKPVADFAKVSNLELSVATDMTAKSMKAFGLDASKASRVADTYVQVASSARIPVEDLYAAVESSGGAFASSGQSLETYLSLVGYMGQRGVPATKAAQALGSAMVKMSVAGSPASKGLKALHISATELVNGRKKFREFDDIIGDIQDKTAGMDDAAKRKALSKIFDAKALKVLLPLFNENSTALSKFVDKVEGAGGKSAKVAALIEGTTADKIERLKGIISEKGIDIVGKIFGNEKEMSKIVDAIRRFDVTPIVNGAQALGKLVGFLAEHSEGVLTLVKGFAMIKAMMVAKNVVLWGSAMVTAIRGMAMMQPQLATTAATMGMMGAATGVGGVGMSAQRTFAASRTLGTGPIFFGQHMDQSRLGGKATGKGGAVTMMPPGPEKMKMTGAQMAGGFSAAVQALGVGVAIGTMIADYLEGENRRRSDEATAKANALAGGRANDVESQVRGMTINAANVDDARRQASSLRAQQEEQQYEQISAVVDPFTTAFWADVFGGGELTGAQGDLIKAQDAVATQLEAKIAQWDKQQEVKVTIEVTGDGADKVKVKSTASKTSTPTAPPVNKGKTGKQ